MSTLVKTPSGCMPANNAKPETPEPVPTSTTARACTTLASRVNALADPRLIGDTPSCAARSRACAACSVSATKSSAKTHDAGFGATLGEVLAATKFTKLSLSKRIPNEPYDGRMSHTVVAELVAAVMKVEVEVGQAVAADDPVVILESMKMEIPVLADVAGSVSEIVVAAGDVVNDGDPLVVIKVGKV
jgi:acetyl-CoA carboxylase biotin carboxyl carrier protein